MSNFVDARTKLEIPGVKRGVATRRSFFKRRLLDGHDQVPLVLWSMTDRLIYSKIYVIRLIEVMLLIIVH